MTIHTIVCHSIDSIDFNVWIIHAFCLIRTQHSRIFVRFTRAPLHYDNFCKWHKFKQTSSLVSQTCCIPSIIKQMNRLYTTLANKSVLSVSILVISSLQLFSLVSNSLTWLSLAIQSYFKLAIIYKIIVKSIFNVQKLTFYLSSFTYLVSIFLNSSSNWFSFSLNWTFNSWLAEVWNVRKQFTIYIYKAHHIDMLWWTILTYIRTYWYYLISIWQKKNTLPQFESDPEDQLLVVEDHSVHCHALSPCFLPVSLPKCFTIIISSSGCVTKLLIGLPLLIMVYCVKCCA